MSRWNSNIFHEKTQRPYIVIQRTETTCIAMIFCESGLPNSDDIAVVVQCRVATTLLH
jgi:hypothetical protein